MLKNSLKIQNLKKIYNSKCVVNDFQLSVSTEDSIAIVGENGAGKSTVLGIIAGYIEPSSGSVFKSSTRICPQQNILWDCITVEEHLEIYSKINGTQNKDYIELCDLANQQHKKASELSGGMKRRLSLAISAIGDPEILLLDEPTTGLDPIIKRQIWKFIQKIKKNKVLIFTSHSMDDIEQLGNNVIVMDKGKIMSNFSLTQLKNKLGNRYHFSVYPRSAESFDKELKEVLKKFSVNDKGVFSFSLHQNDKDMVRILEILEKSAEVKNWEIHQEPLEIIFSPENTLSKENEEYIGLSGEPN